MLDYLRSRVTIWVILGALAVAGGLIMVLAGFFFLIPMRSSVPTPLGVQLTLIPGPSLTPIPVTSTPAPTSQQTPAEVGGIAVGMFVQITGTGGDGLRLRSGPGTSNPPRFLGGEAEVFRVKDGPKIADGFTWWFLEAPYDPNRAGWAASQYLAVVVPPQQTPQ
jgi:hypothetical protein